MNIVRGYFHIKTHGSGSCRGGELTHLANTTKPVNGVTANKVPSAVEKAPYPAEDSDHKGLNTQIPVDYGLVRCQGQLVPYESVAVTSRGIVKPYRE